MLTKQYTNTVYNKLSIRTQPLITLYKSYTFTENKDDTYQSKGAVCTEQRSAQIFAKILFKFECDTIEERQEKFELVAMYL